LRFQGARPAWRPQRGGLPRGISFPNRDRPHPGQHGNRCEDSLKSIDLSGVQIAIQTMPPFPWHFGGQSYHNLFLNADEIVQFCIDNPEIKICLDISHTMMACNYYGWDIREFVRKVGDYVVHLHIVDALGIDGEGVEIGKGDVDFISLSKAMKTHCKEIQFIPEVWQGHKNGGEGFWNALNFLEKIGM
jgi:sugar phosphate isomerase/epimerase